MVALPNIRSHYRPVESASVRPQNDIVIRSSVAYGGEHSYDYMIKRSKSSGYYIM